MNVGDKVLVVKAGYGCTDAECTVIGKTGTIFGEFPNPEKTWMVRFEEGRPCTRFMAGARFFCEMEKDSVIYPPEDLEYRPGKLFPEDLI